MIYNALYMAVHICNPSTQEVEAGESKVRGPPELPRETLSQRGDKKNHRISK
jgi:hypothetical protein